MAAYVGILGVLVAFVAAIVVMVRGAVAFGPSAEVTVTRLRGPSVALLVGSVISMLALELALLNNDFSLEYVANHHSAGTPLIFTVSAAWSALEGSILLWGLVLAVLTFTVYRSTERRGAGDGLGVGALSILGAISAFFFGLMLTIANPFQVCVEAATFGCGDASVWPWAASVTPEAGRGTNPLLQNHILMAVHPPVLYVGYVGLSVPFAFAMSSLAGLHRGAEWLQRTRRWTLIAWAFLTAGILLGGWWSYEVLGWGGYWAWDPVENASFMPWLMATAFIHSSVVQARRGVLQAWNYVLVIATFSLTILGTFLTRSGAVESVHSFTESPVGPALLGFLAVILVLSFSLFATRSHLVASAPRLDSLVSREGVFLLNNLLLTVFAFVVLAGTLFPLVFEALQGNLVSIGQPFFDRWAVPLSFALLAAMGVGPVTPYRVARPEVVWDRIRLPLQVALAAGAAMVIFGSRLGFVVLAVILGTFVVAVIVRHLFTLASAAAAKRGGSVWANARRIIGREPGYWGGQISHVGVAVLAVGMAMSANLVTTGEVSMTQGERVDFADFELEFVSPFARTEPNRTAIGAEIDVYRDGERVTTLHPRLNQYQTMQAAIQTPAVYTTLRGDLYLSLTRVDGGGISMDMWDYPLQWMIWTGGLVTAAGAGFSLTAIRRRGDRRTDAGRGGPEADRAPV